MKKTFRCARMVLMLVMMVAPMLCPIHAQAAASSYAHDPRLNVKAMEDIIVDDTAVYGFRPDPNSERLAAYADADWSDPELVEKARQERITYHNQYATMYVTWQEMEAMGCSTEQIARTVSAMRNQIRLDSYQNDPEGLARCKASNLQKYGDENGPTADSLYAKYGSWNTVLLKAFAENPGMDACLGLYDDYYDKYASVGNLAEMQKQTYTVKEGDTLSKIAEKYYGNSAKWTVIYTDNAGTVKDPNAIYTGESLIINID